MSGHGKVLDAALAAFDRLGLAEADAYVESFTHDSISVADGKVESAENKAGLGMGVRALREGRVGFAYTADLSPEGIDAVVARARDAAEHASPDASHRLPTPEAPPDIEGNVDRQVERFPTEEKVELARRIERAARQHDPRVKRTREASYQDVAGTISLARAGGYRYSYSFTRAYGAVDLIAEGEGEIQSGAHVDFGLGPASLDPERIGRTAAERAVHKLGGKACPTRRMSVLLIPEVVDGLLGELAAVFFAENVLKGKSLLAGRMGQTIAGSRVTLVNDGRLPGGCGTAPIDGEGVATRATTLVEGGALRALLHDGFSATRMGEPPTGSAMRDSYAASPETGTAGLSLRPTGERREDLLRAAGNGLLVEEVMGLHTINPISGDFSLGACGRAVRDGEPREAVAGIGIAGNVRELLASIAGIADDLCLMPSGNAASTILLEGISVGGE